LYRRGRLADADLDAQMDEIGKEERGLEAQVTELRGKIAGADAIGATINSAQALLEKLRRRLDEPICWELKRRIIEVLVAGGRVDTVECWGVKQGNITVTYRFSPTDQALPLVLPQSYGTGAAIGMPTELHTIGDHLRRRRLVLKLHQKQAAEQIGVDKTSIHNWETGVTEPGFEYMPAIIRFVGYNPLPEGDGWGQRLVRQRRLWEYRRKPQRNVLGSIRVAPSLFFGRVFSNNLYRIPVDAAGKAGQPVDICLDQPVKGRMAYVQPMASSSSLSMAAARFLLLLFMAIRLLSQ
jgi:transcriptional regulator with XRE-family HTH domain